MICDIVNAKDRGGAVLRNGGHEVGYRQGYYFWVGLWWAAINFTRNFTLDFREIPPLRQLFGRIKKSLATFEN